MADFDLADLYDNYDPDQIDTSKRGERPDPLPEGEYLMQAIEAECIVKENEDVMLKLVFDVIGGEYEGRKIWEYQNIKHSNPLTQKLGQEAYTNFWRDGLRLSSKPSGNPDQFLFRPLAAKVRIAPAKNGYPASNKIEKYLPAGQSTPAARPAQAATSAPTTSGGSRPAFLKRA
jgi:hypothetical protein